VKHIESYLLRKWGQRSWKKLGLKLFSVAMNLAFILDLFGRFFAVQQKKNNPSQGFAVIIQPSLLCLPDIFIHLDLFAYEHILDVIIFNSL